ncbi:hypothetical protein HC031_03535 [Planosporangium thailandense]|uniref:WD40 repeat domain-containing protein n=1 Tax=Planosporangium thailandense TaxID=765197 RepID=A0ABX0XTX3_9ACTN|nr:hypothetical protein [Planosporangium thailandense]NJC68802.1 hypothetical protein [Planosporangium thailandense]
MNDFAPGPLHDALADLAETAQPVDLRDRALRTSRRLAVRRSVTVTAAAVVLLGVTAAGVGQVLPQRTAPHTPAASDSATPEPQPSSPAPEPTTPEPSASSTPAASESGATVTVGPLYYGDLSPDPSGFVVSWLPGDTQSKAIAKLPVDFAVTFNVNVSPDGRWVSYVRGDTSALHLVDVRTGRDRVLREHVDGQCAEPAWSSDSRRLLVSVSADGSANARQGLIDVTTGAFTPLATAIQGCHLTWAADGAAIGYADGNGKIFVAKPDGSGQRAVPGINNFGTPPYSGHLESVSPQGRQIALWLSDGTTPVGDVSRGLYSNAVIDTRTGQKVKLPVPDSRLLQALFRGDGSMVLRVKGDQHNQLVIVSADGAELNRWDEPAALKNLTMLTS